ncbi:hypothetical protein OAT71_02400 [Flavobacteriales bacterium]|nr:hypothetical protein [Flavobacteriales bacterium]
MKIKSLENFKDDLLDLSSSSIKGGAPVPTEGGSEKSSLCVSGWLCYDSDIVYSDTHRTLTNSHDCDVDDWPDGGGVGQRDTLQRTSGFTLATTSFASRTA